MREKNDGECIPLVLSTSVTFLRESGRNNRQRLTDYLVRCFSIFGAFNTCVFEARCSLLKIHTVYLIRNLPSHYFIVSFD